MIKHDIEYDIRTMSTNIRINIRDCDLHMLLHGEVSNNLERRKQFEQSVQSLLSEAAGKLDKFYKLHTVRNM